MIGSFVLALLGAAVATTPCENLKTLKLSNTTITSADFVPEGPPQRGGNRGGAQAARGAGAPAAQAQAAAGQGGDGQRGAGARGGRGAAQPPANIPAHCRVQLVLKPTSDSLIN